MEEIAKRMKKLLLPVIAICLSGNTLLAGNWFGPGPFANGAYYPGQYDGVYSASMFGSSPSVVSGVLGFGLRNGAPSTSTNSTSTNSISVDPNQNYFVAFIDGVTYSGQTVGNLNNQENSVNGGLFNGIAPSIFSVLVTTNNPGTTNQTVTITQLEQRRTAGGAFFASLTGKKATITFSGNNTGTIEPSLNGITLGTPSTFSLNGMKVGNQTTTTATTTAQ
jgi:hypothetical protein